MRERYTLTAGGDGVRLVRGPVPPCADTEVLLRVRHSLISAGTERHYVAQLAGGRDELPLGYCAVGTVVEHGERVDGVAPGDLAIAMGWTIATHSDYVVVPARLVCAVPQGVRAEHALLATLGATAVHAADRAALIERDRVLVVGLGALGTLMAMVAADRGCPVWGWDLDPEARARRLWWRELDREVARGTITAALLCVDGDLGALFDLALPLLDLGGNGARRSRVVNVGRVTGAITLAPATGNIDLVNASRCGAGYRDDAYHHGLHDVPVVDGEHRVDDNLRRALEVIARHPATLERVPFRHHTPAQALALYAGAGVPPGIHVIDHESP
jgi:NADPH2:quinone reductase